jgi:hypothetical protein
MGAKQNLAKRRATTITMQNEFWDTSASIPYLGIPDLEDVRRESYPPLLHHCKARIRIGQPSFILDFSFLNHGIALLPSFRLTNRNLFPGEQAKAHLPI